MSELLEAMRFGAAAAERRQHLKAQAALQALREREIAAQAELIGQRSQALMEEKAQKEQDASDLLASQELYHYHTEVGGKTPEEAQTMVDQALAYKNPRALEMVNKARALGRKDQGGSFSPTIETPVNPMTGEKVPVLRTGPNTSQMLEGKEAPDQVGLEFKRYKAAEAGGDAELAAFHKGRLLKLSQSTGTTIKTNPDGTVEVVQGAVVGGPDAITKTNLNKVQEAQAQSLATIDVANRLEPLIDSDTVGAKAFAESWIKDRILAQSFPELASGKRAKAEQLAAQLRATAVKELRSDGNITEGERKQILQAIPSINDPVDSPARAKDLVQGVRKMAAIRALVAAKRIGGAVPKSAAMALDDEALAELFSQGLITQEQAKQAYQLKRQ